MGQREAPGLRLGHLQGGYTHDISAENEEEWNAKHRRYARQEAEEIMKQPEPFGALLRRACFGSGLGRRRAIKHLSYYLPARRCCASSTSISCEVGFSTAGAPGATAGCWRATRGFATTELKRLRAQSHG